MIQPQSPQRELESLRLKVAMLEALLKYREAKYAYELGLWESCAEYWRKKAEGDNL